MWPMLLNMTRDDCRRTLRRLELEAYSNMISVFRAQGALEDNRKKLLEDLRGVLHISSDRHSAEARRAANDELLATIADQLAGPNTGLGWISEGRRRVPLMPRGTPQTAYTEIADKAALQASAENKELQKKLEAERNVLVAPKSNEEEIPDAEGETAEGTLDTNATMDDLLYPPIVMEDQSVKFWETEALSRKRKVPESGTLPEDVAATPVKNVRNTSHNTNQKHLNLSQIYSNYSKTPPGITGKTSSQSKHSYNQVSKVSSKSNQHPQRSNPPKHRAHKQTLSHRPKNPIVISKSQMKKSLEIPPGTKTMYNPVSLQLDYGGPPATFQASYAQSILGHKTKSDLDDDDKPQISSPPHIMTDSPTMQLLTQPATVPHEIGVTDPAHSDDPSSLQAQGTPVTRHTLSGKACHLIIKKKGDISSDKTQVSQKVQMSEIKIVQKAHEGMKMLPNRQLVLAPNSTQKALNAPGKLLGTKIVQHMPKAHPQVVAATGASTNPEKLIVLPKTQKAELKSVPNARNIVISSANVMAPVNKDTVTVNTNNISPRTADDGSLKSVSNTDVKLPPKTFLLNPKSGQKMVVLPAKSRAKSAVDGQTVPLLHFKGMPTTMKLVPVSSHSAPQINKPSSNVTIVSRPTIVNTVNTTNTKIVGVEPVKTASMADITPSRVVQNVPTTPKITTNAVVRPVSSKGSVIVVQKGATLGKTLSFTKNCNDVSKIIMSKNVNQLIQASAAHKQEQAEGIKNPSNIIVLELNNDQLGRATTMSEILDNHAASSTGRTQDADKVSHQVITEDTPVLFDNQITDETCNASSMDSTAESIADMVPMEDGTISSIEKEDETKSLDIKESDSAKDTSSSVTDWEMELESVSRKDKDEDKLNSLHLELGMSSDSETDSYLVDTKKSKTKSLPQESLQRQARATDESGEIFATTAGLSQAGRTLLSQLHDDGSSSNDSSFALDKTKIVQSQKGSSKLDLTASDKSASEALSKAKEKLSERVSDEKSQQKRIDIFSTAITSADIHLDSFEYLEEGIMAGDEIFSHESDSKVARSGVKDHPHHLDMQLSHLLAENVSSSEAHNVSENTPLSK